MRIAIPLLDGKLATHFGHCELFALIDVNENDKSIIKREDLTPPPHEPGVLPKWLGEQATTHVITGGMGMHAQNLLQEQGIKVFTGITSDVPENIVNKFLSEDLEAGANACNH